jgi:hypothetical protein
MSQVVLYIRCKAIRIIGDVLLLLTYSNDSAGLLVAAVVFCLTLPYTRDYIPSAERAFAPAIGLALPLVLVRLAYQVLVVFVHRGAFSPLGQG